MAHAEGPMGYFYFERDAKATVSCWEATPVAHGRTRVMMARCGVVAETLVRIGWILHALIKYNRLTILWG